MDALIFPDLNPVAFAIGPVAVRWYALAYIMGFVLGWRLALWLADRLPATLIGRPSRQDFDDFISWGILGVILGGRLGYVLFYNLPYYLEHPIEALHIWQGGMSFHGGIIGMAAAIIWFTRQRKINTLSFGDVAGTVATIGLGLGRVANFINGELVGRPVESDVPWAMIFPKIDELPRHPSQLYEAATEGLLLFIIMISLMRSDWVKSRPGFAFGIFTCLYACFRAFCELFRSPDVQLGFLAGGTTMGQLLCIPMFLIGLWLVIRAVRRGPQLSAPLTA